MEALFDRYSGPVGWMEHGTHIFDLEMNWVAFVFEHHAWSVATGHWLGPVMGTTCFDREGRVVAWHYADALYRVAYPTQPRKPIRPLAPRKPQKPIRYARPARPIDPPGGWSKLGWLGWIAQ